MKINAHRHLALAVVFLLPGCAALKPAKDHESRYILDALPGKTVQGRRHCVIRLPPVQVARYLQGDEITVRDNGNKIDYPLNNRWAEPLDAGMRRVLSADLRVAPFVEQVLIDEPAYPGRPVDTVSVRLLSCEGVKTNGVGVAEFSAAWEITEGAAPERIVAHGIFQPAPKPWPPGNYARLAADLSQDIRELSEVILDALARQNH